MHSNDSGCATMYSSSVLGNQEFVSKSPARPITIGPEYINMASNNDDYINLYACKTSLAGKRDPPPPPPPPKRKNENFFIFNFFAIFAYFWLHIFFQFSKVRSMFFRKFDEAVYFLQMSLSPSADTVKPLLMYAGIIRGRTLLKV